MLGTPLKHNSFRVLQNRVEKVHLNSRPLSSRLPWDIILQYPSHILGQFPCGAHCLLDFTCQPSSLPLPHRAIRPVRVSQATAVAAQKNIASIEEARFIIGSAS